MIHAAIAIGSNSTRMLTADCTDTVRPLCRERVETRLMMGLDKTNTLTPDAMLSTARVVADFKEKALSLGAQSVSLMATSAARDAQNQQEFSQIISDMTGLSLQIITGEEEAALAFQAVAGKKTALVVDIGGGSTEVTFGKDGRILKSVSAQVGSSRLLKIRPIASKEDALFIKNAAAQVLHEALLPVLSCMDTHEKISMAGIGGSCTTSASMLMKKEAHGDQVEGYRVTRQDAENLLWMLAPLSPEERARVPGLPSSRVLHMPHGLCILLSVMEESGMDAFTVSGRTNLDGFMLSLCS